MFVGDHHLPTTDGRKGLETLTERFDRNVRRFISDMYHA